MSHSNQEPSQILTQPKTTLTTLQLYNMSRTLSLVLSCLLLLSLIGEAQSLVSLVFNIRQNAIWGVLGRGTQGPQHSNSIPAPSTISIAPASFAVAPDVIGFDPDEYRREMTDLVYQRNLQRFSS